MKIEKQILIVEPILLLNKLKMYRRLHQLPSIGYKYIHIEHYFFSNSNTKPFLWAYTTYTEYEHISSFMSHGIIASVAIKVILNINKSARTNLSKNDVDFVAQPANVPC